jgi:hypothetical protein
MILNKQFFVSLFQVFPDNVVPKVKTKDCTDELLCLYLCFKGEPAQALPGFKGETVRLPNQYDLLI